jgi:hypothetical protein
MRFDGTRVWSIIATVSFRLSHVNICRASIAGLLFLALAGVVRGGEGARNIEVVPMHNTAMDTNFDQLSRADRQTFENWAPRAASRATVQPQPKGALIPPPRPQSAEPTQRERELMDRRRNWVFLTPEEYLSNGEKNLGVEEFDKDGADNKSTMTAMQRYYQRLYDADHAPATNLLSKADSGHTNLITGGLRNTEAGSFLDNPFSTTPDAGIFDPGKTHSFADVFGSQDNPALRSPESIRLEADQKARMDSFKQLWNIDQPAVATVASPVSGPIQTESLFGNSSGSLQPALSPVSSSAGGSSIRPQAPQPLGSTDRTPAPPRSTFAPPQRPF